MTGATADPDLAALLRAPWRRRGRFALHVGPEGAACVPLGWAPARVGTVLRHDLPVLPGPWSPRAAARLAVAIRQQAWRALQGTRGMVPVVLVRPAAGAVAASVLLCHIDGAAASPRALDRLARIFDDAVTGRDTAWARRPGPRRTRR